MRILRVVLLIFILTWGCSWLRVCLFTGLSNFAATLRARRDATRWRAMSDFSVPAVP
jgi:hypothetical protein